MIGKLIGQGRTAEIFEWNNGQILKLFRHGVPKSNVESEYHLSLALAQNHFPVPKVYGLIEYENRWGIVYERIYGISLLRSIALKPWSVLKLAKKYAQTHVSIQKKIAYDLPRFKDRLLESFMCADSLEVNLKEKLRKYLEELPDEDILCHGDFHPDNILVFGDKFIIIDWNASAKGSPLSDVARVKLLLEFAVLPEYKSYLEVVMISFVRTIFCKEYLRHYLKITGASLADVEKWEIPHAAARLVEELPKTERDLLVNYVKEKMGRVV